MLQELQVINDITSFSQWNKIKQPIKSTIFIRKCIKDKIYKNISLLSPIYRKIEYFSHLYFKTREYGIIFYKIDANNDEFVLFYHENENICYRTSIY